MSGDAKCTMVAIICVAILLTAWIAMDYGKQYMSIIRGMEQTVVVGRNQPVWQYPED